MSNKVTGRVLVIMDAQKISEKFIKRDFVIEPSGEMYPQKVVFQLVQDKTTIIDGFIPGDEIEVSYNLRGRDWTNPQGETKYFNTLECWRIERGGAYAPPKPNESMPISAPTTSAEDDDLPF
tara:strand:+ start:1271 stop:1636 length:366 start_codon:yes stop_codon:yes gene_type:complete